MKESLRAADMAKSTAGKLGVNHLFSSRSEPEFLCARRELFLLLPETFCLSLSVSLPLSPSLSRPQTKKKGAVGYTLNCTAKKERWIEMDEGGKGICNFRFFFFFLPFF